MPNTPDTLVTTMPIAGDWRELDTRRNDGLTISLYWSKSLDRVKVTVLSAAADEQLELVVAGTEALEAFTHPFAYAAARDLPVGEARLGSGGCSTWDAAGRTKARSDDAC